ncbi:MAG: LysR family transcriptional regulator [Lachnospiraceae bacterium]|nr:LysR family transcriptional regulator [Lachnospiraceae bacterium]
MTSRQLQLFLSIADLGSFSRAEKTEYISKQAILRQMNSLEDEVGEKLFWRTAGGIALTDAGRTFYDGAKEILDLEKDVLARCRNAGPAQEILRISHVEHQALLNEVTEAFSAKYPDIRIQRVVHPNHSGEFRVEQGIADVGETFYMPEAASAPFSYTRLADMPYLAAMAHQHPLAACGQVSLAELTAYPVIIYEQMINKEYLQQLKETFSAHPAGGSLDIRRDVDAQVAAAFECAETNAILLTANCFVRTIPELTTVPLSEGWRQEYGIIYRPNPSRTVRKYIDLAVAIYSSHHS